MINSSRFNFKTIKAAIITMKKKQIKVGQSKVVKYWNGIKLLALFTNLLIIIGCFIIVLHQGTQCIVRYFASETKTILNVFKSGDSTFVAFTFCPGFHVAYNKTFLKEHNSSSTEYQSGFFYDLNGDLSTEEMREGATFSLFEVLKTITIATESKTEPMINLIFENNRWNETKAKFKTKYHSKFGLCYSMELLPAVTKLAIINIVVKSRMDIYVYLHHPGQYNLIDSKTKAYANVGKRVFIDISNELSVNTLGDDENHIACQREINFAYDDCILQGIASKLEQRFGCIVPWLPLIKPNGTQMSICEFKNESAEAEAERKHAVQRYNYWSSSGLSKLCPLPCATMDIFLGLPFGGTTDNETAYIKMYMKSTVKVKKTVLDYTWLSMLAEIGGYTGLLLGVSVVHITSLINKFLFKMKKG